MANIQAMIRKTDKAIVGAIPRGTVEETQTTL